MKTILFLLVAAGCATAPGPKRPDESHRIAVNRTVPAEVAGALPAEPTKRADRRPARAGEVEWR